MECGLYESTHGVNGQLWSCNPEDGEIPGHPGNVDSPQPFFSQGFHFYVGELDFIQVELDSFDDALCSVESESDRLDFR